MLCLPAYGQSLVDDATISTSGESGAFTETIKVISSSKKIFILTNNNNQLGPGDFISLALDDKLAARALVGKLHQGQVGIKILKIYSMAQWTRLRRDTDVQIVKGDDTLFGKKSTSVAVSPLVETAKIKSEDDLYTANVTVEEELGEIDESKNRHIRPDNLVALTAAFKDVDERKSLGGTVRSNEFGISWAFQFADNFFAEGLYGRAMVDSFPNDGMQTLINHYTGRLKYNIKGPLYTFFMPYIGFHTYTVSSPDAGTSPTLSEQNEELDAVDNIKKTGVVAGVTVLRRLVPGWFIKADLGTDIINAGFAIEF
jgi:hypothetical protein